MRFANVSGRACLVVDGRAVDIGEASGGALNSDPMMTADLAKPRPPAGTGRRGRSVGLAEPRWRGTWSTRAAPRQDHRPSR